MAYSPEAEKGVIDKVRKPLAFLSYAILILGALATAVTGSAAIVAAGHAGVGGSLMDISFDKTVGQTAADAEKRWRQKRSK